MLRLPVIDRLPSLKRYRLLIGDVCPEEITVKTVELDVEVLDFGLYSIFKTESLLAI